MNEGLGLGPKKRALWLIEVQIHKIFKLSVKIAPFLLRPVAFGLKRKRRGEEKFNIRRFH